MQQALQNINVGLSEFKREKTLFKHRRQEEKGVNLHQQATTAKQNVFRDEDSKTRRLEDSRR